MRWLAGTTIQAFVPLLNLILDFPFSWLFYIQLQLIYLYLLIGFFSTTIYLFIFLCLFLLRSETVARWHPAGLRSSLTGVPVHKPWQEHPNSRSPTIHVTEQCNRLWDERGSGMDNKEYHKPGPRLHFESRRASHSSKITGIGPLWTPVWRYR